VALALGASGFITWLLRAHAGQQLFSLSLSMILGGALGNVIDRLQHGYVVDFLDFTGRFWMACSTVATSRPSTWPMRPSRPALGLVLDELLRGAAQPLNGTHWLTRPTRVSPGAGSLGPMGLSREACHR
jgi:signal peptidase II